MSSNSSRGTWLRVVTAGIAVLMVAAIVRLFGGALFTDPAPAAPVAATTSADAEPATNGPVGSGANERIASLGDVSSAPLVGNVVDEQGHPVAGAEVAAGPRTSIATDEATHVVRALDPARSRSTRTDANGSFRIEGLATGRVDVVARAPGHFPAAVVDLALEVHPIPAVVLRLARGRTLKGTVASAFGQPIAGASVVVDVTDWRPDDAARIDELTRQASSDAEGRFRIEGLPPLRPLRALATARGYLDGQAVRIAPAEQTVVIRLEASPAVLLQIIDLENGAALPDATVAFAREATASAATSPLLLRGEQAGQRLGQVVPAGAVVATDLPQSSSVFLVSAEGHATARIDVQGLEPGEVRNRLVELEPEARLAGQITRSQGAPVAAAAIRAYGAAASDATAALVAGDFARADPRSGFGPRTRPDWLAATSDAEGRFELRGLAAGRYRVLVVVDGHTDLVEPIDVEVERGPNEMPPIVLQARATLECAVFDARGRPLGGAFVAITAWFEDGAGANFLETMAEPLATARTDGTGNTTVDWLPPGRVVVRVRTGEAADPTQDVRSEVELRAGQTERVTVRLPGRWSR